MNRTVCIGLIGLLSLTGKRCRDIRGSFFCAVRNRHQRNSLARRGNRKDLCAWHIHFQEALVHCHELKAVSFRSSVEDPIAALNQNV